MFQGDYPASEKLLREVIDRSGDATLAAKASALLLSNLGLSQRYQEAYALANRLTSLLPSVNDPLARSMLLGNLSQMFNLAGQTDLAVKYADMMMEGGTPSGETCYPLSLRVAALYEGHRLRPDGNDVAQAVSTCVQARQPVLANTMRLVQIDRFLDERQPHEALEALERVWPSIQANKYYPHMLSSQVQQAKAYEMLGRNDQALKAARAAIAMAAPSETSEYTRDAYGVLYRTEKALGNAAKALEYYERYSVQDRGNLNDVTARTLAFELSRQHVVVQKLETERLSRQNSILRLQKALETKAVETSRLYISLLSMFLLSVVFWLFRLKRSQVRFMRLSWHDGLTGIFNRQHFMSEADRVLKTLEKRRVDACLVFIDLDHFKQVNDTYGHAMGDLVLRHTVAICQRQLGSGTLFGRLGGEEFGILLQDCRRERAIVVADRIRMAIESAPVEEDGRVLSISASVGVASTDGTGHALLRLCREADLALYRAKRAGRNRVMADIA
ncbi:GGDEF domain-containing protein [Luteibacter yeojuensis]|uniref:diguanylate cyclase n=2 Tax=Luteibacter yeojuensis TaxID=345309 RepID=A0A7X5QSP9_9GAMM|nr:GGDEF domain-containing protein [Luteibacter yeojuensis]